MKGLYLVTDRALCEKRKTPLEEVVLQAVQGGTAYVQLREKDMSTRAFMEEAKVLKDMLDRFGVPLIVNDRVDIALAVGADGVHLGQSDMPYNVARGIMGPEAIIGVSVETWDDVEKVEKLDCDYVGISPVFSTPTKTDTKGEWGIDGVTKIRAFSRHKLVAIGGINETNAWDVVRAGADCIAVVSAICSAEDPFTASKNLVDIYRAAGVRG